MSGITSPALPSFSYAQAAKGMSLPPTTNQTAPESQAQKDDASSNAPKVSGAEPAVLDLALVSPESAPAADEQATQEEQRPEHSLSDVAPETTLKSRDQPTKRNHSAGREPSSTHASSSPDSGPTSTQPTSTSDEASSTLRGSSDSTWDEQSQTSNFLEKPTLNNEDDKELEQDQKSDEKRNDSVIEPELKAAPIPAFNVWQERQKAQEAKAQANGTVKKPPLAQILTNTTGVKNDSGKGAAGTRSEEKEGVVGKEKKPGSEGPKGKEDPRKANARVNRQIGDSKTFAEHSGPLSVADAAMWPTPENATFEDRRKSQTLERPEKPEMKSPASKSHGKNKWEHVPHVPSVKFTTPLPPAAARRGGKGPSRGGRDGTNRIGHTPSSSIGGEKPIVMGPPPIPRQESQRGRNETQSQAARPNSLPGPARRASSVDTATTERGKPAPIGQSEQRRPENKKSVETKNNESTSAEATAPMPKPRRNSRTFARGPSGLTTPSHRTSFNNGTPNNHLGEAQTFPRHSDRRNTAHELFKDAGLGLDRGDIQFGKEYPRGRGSNGERYDFGRERMDSWRDREPYNDRMERRDPRPERSGRGNHRGRGNHSGFGTHGSQPHAFTAPLPQQPFATPKLNAYNSDKPRQTSGPYFGQSQNQSSSRNATRANTMGSGQVYGTTNGLSNMPQQLTPILTEFNTMYNFPNVPMTAQPYSQITDPYTILSMVAVQLEYYFSVDNLCKDIFLRKHMDSQGFVPLNFIAGFKRIKTLTEDMNLIRFACQSSNNIDYMPGDEGKEKVRANGHWRQWVLVMDQRDESAKNDGPVDSNGLSSLQQLDGTTASAGINNNPRSVESNGPVNGDVTESTPFAQSEAAYDYQIVDTPVSAAVNEAIPNHANNMAPRHVEPEPSNESKDEMNEGEVAQSQPQPPLQNGLGFVSVSPDQQENMFTNQQTEHLTVVWRDSTEGAGQSHQYFAPTESRTFSNGSLDNNTLAEQSHHPNFPPTLPGGASDLHHHRSGSSSNWPDRHHEKHPPEIWVKSGTPPVNLYENGLRYMPYATLRSMAFTQRQILGNTSPEMEILYQFWSHFLVKNFNADMYDEFHGLASENSKFGFKRGLDRLLRYYEAALFSPRVVPDRVAADLINMVTNESEYSRPAFTILRAVWRNGAFLLKSRKKIDNLITAQLRAELEV
ncbi:MAG: hypothetical protein Q9160_000867 [Pyrenula sp. 1 TL-2023]